MASSRSAAAGVVVLIALSAGAAGATPATGVDAAPPTEVDAAPPTEVDAAPTTGAGAIPATEDAGADASLEDTVAGGNWTPHYTIDVYRNGTATVTTTVEGSGVPDVIRLITERSKDVEVLAGEAGLTYQSSGTRYYNWRPAEAEQVSFSVTLGHQDRPVNTGRFDDAVLFALSEVVPVWGWYGGESNLPDAHRYTVRTPEGWDVAGPGRRIDDDTYELFPAVERATFPRDMVLVGDIETERRDLATTELRVTSVPSADPPRPLPDLADFSATVARTLGEVYRTTPKYGRLLVVTPASHETGGLARDHSLIIDESAPVFEVATARSVYAHEFAHTYQRFRGPTWHSEGQASYMQFYALLRAGIVNESTFRRMLQTWITTPPNEIGDPVSGSAGAEPYYKGAAVYAALDSDIRARSDGARDISDFVGIISDRRNATDGPYAQRFDVHRDDELAVLRNLTDRDYALFYERYVDGTEMPSELLAGNFSLSDPVPIADDAETGAALRAELAVKEERIATLESRLNETLARNAQLEAQLNETLTRNAQLEAQLNETLARNDRLEERLNETLARNAQLEAQLNETLARNDRLAEQRNQSARRAERLATRLNETRERAARLAAQLNETATGTTASTTRTERDDRTATTSPATGDSGPGFSAALALVGLALAALGALARRRR